MHTKTLMTVEDHTSKTKIGSRANRDSPCDTGTPQFPLLPTATVGFRGSDITWRATLDTTAVEQCVPSISLDTTGLDCATRWWTYFLVKKQEVRGKGLKENLSSMKYSLSQGCLAVSSGQNSNELLLMHSCSVRGKQPTHNTSAGGENTKQGQQRTRRRQHLRMNPSGSLCHSAVERTIVSRTHEGKLNGSNSQ